PSWALAQEAEEPKPAPAAPEPESSAAPVAPPPAAVGPARNAAAPPAPPVAAAQPEAPPAGNHGNFAFGTYGRIIAATDGRGRAGGDADIVAHGSRLDESNYVELELRREDAWAKTNSTTRVVATLAIASPIFHYTGDFNISMAVRNLYIEENGLAKKGL